MKKITCIQQYVIDKLIDDKKISIGSLIDATSKVCSNEQFNNILSILIEKSIPCANTPELEYKEDSENKTNLVRISMFIPEKTSAKAKIAIIKILMEQFNFSLNQTKEYVDSCIGRYNIFPKVITQKDIDTIIEKLKPYDIAISTVGFY